MRKYILLFICFLFLSTSIYALRMPASIECEQRGYEISGRNCTMPDNTICPIEDFENDLCGYEFKSQDYCVGEGKAIWQEDKCCEGLKPYLAPNVEGQPACQPISKRLKGNMDYLIRNPISWIILLFILGITVYFIYRKSKSK